MIYRKNTRFKSGSSGSTTWLTMLTANPDGLSYPHGEGEMEDPGSIFYLVSYNCNSGSANLTPPDFHMFLQAHGAHTYSQIHIHSSKIKFF